jgi:hypothetical protein
MRSDRAGDAEDDQDERNRTPPVLPKSGQAMAALPPCPEDAKEHQDETQQPTNKSHHESLRREAFRGKEGSPVRVRKRALRFACSAGVFGTGSLGEALGRAVHRRQLTSAMPSECERAGTEVRPAKDGGRRCELREPDRDGSRGVPASALPLDHVRHAKGHAAPGIEEIVDRRKAYDVMRKTADEAERVAEETDPRT